MLLNAPATRLRMWSCVTEAFNEFSGTSKHITANAPTNSAAASAAAFTQVGPSASAAIAIAPGKTTAPPAITGPAPKRRLSGDAATAPSRPPDAPMPNARPMVPADSPRLRLANSTSRAVLIKLKKLTVVAQPRLRLRDGCLSRYRMPARARRGGGSGDSPDTPGPTLRRPIWTAGEKNGNAAAKH